MTLKGFLDRRAVGLSLLLTGLGTLAATATPAQAAPLPTAASCPAPAVTSQPFAAWGDENAYWLVPGGDFNGSLAGWTLTGDADVVPGGSPWTLPGTGASASSLSLGAGATVTSPAVCVDAGQPTFRLLDAGSPGSLATVSVVYQTASGNPVTVPVGAITGGSWQPSPTFQDGAAIAGALGGGTAQMSVRFTAVSGSTQIDDVFVDPRMGW